MLRRLALVVPLVVPTGCEALAFCVEEEEFFTTLARRYCEYTARCHAEELETTIDDCTQYVARAGWEFERGQVGDRCSTGFDECEAGRCLVVFAQATNRFCDTEMPDEYYDDPCFDYSYWEGATESCWDTVE